MRRPSEPILEILRDWVRKKGFTTAQLAERTGVERTRLKHILAGQEPMDVDEFLLVTQALDLGPEELGLAGPSAPAPEQVGPALVGPASTGPRLVSLSRPPQDDAPRTESRPKPLQLRPFSGGGRDGGAARTGDGEDDDAFEPPDALGNLPKQILQLGFALGTDLFMVLDAKQLVDSKVPSSVLSRFQDALPIKLEAKYHAHNRPRYQEDCFECVLSFDALYTCTFPWTAFKEVRFLIPEEPIRPLTTPTPPESPRPAGGPQLRVVK